MNLPAPFQVVFDQWDEEGIRLVSADWTTKLHRHVGARVECDGKIWYAKLALAQHKDLDEPEMLNGMRRTVWWSRVIQRLHQENSAWPFVSPDILATNVEERPFRDKVAWVIMEHINGAPILDLGDITPTQFTHFLDAAVSSLLALEKVHPRTVHKLKLPPLPSPPHGMRRWQKKGMLNLGTAVLGNGAFEVENFWRDITGRLVIMDNEFAGWYPRYDHLSYLYHRLYCNAMHPDLAKQVLNCYRHAATKAGNLEILHERGFWKNFARVLRPRIQGGWYYDTVRRWHMPWHKKQRLRYRLMWNIYRNNYGKLIV